MEDYGEKVAQLIESLNAVGLDYAIIVRADEDDYLVTGNGNHMTDLACAAIEWGDAVLTENRETYLAEVNNGHTH